jgi:DNA-binding transcriptional MocR family regulator
VDLKYLALADELEAVIRSGRLAAGNRLQSVRNLMIERGLSLATVVAAYRTLEERALITARPKSGYFVVFNGERRQGNAAPHRSSESSEAAANGDCADLSLFPRDRLRRLTASMVRRHQGLPTNYAHGPGLLKLRREIARRSSEFGTFLRAGEIVVTNGAFEALTLAVRAVIGPGEAIAVEAPGNPNLLAMLRELHIRVIEIPAHPARGFDLGAWESVLLQQPTIRACLLIPNFHHPTGTLMPVPVKRAMLSLAERANLAIIENDVYGDLQYEGPRPPPLKAFDSAGNAIYLTSYSKAIAPGLRVGWVAAGRWQEKIEAAKRHTTAATAELPQLVLHEYLCHGSHLPHFRRMRYLLRERTLRVQDALVRSLPSCRWTNPQGGYFLWLELPKQLDATDLLNHPPLAHVGMRAGATFSAHPSYEHCVRINTSLVSEDAVAALGDRVSRSLDNPT